MAPRKGKGAWGCGVHHHRQWKVGDLVLATVKGHPAWPAMVSEPEQYGKSKNLNKVFVCFFGTGQIAFCARADVQLFTEEMKSSLLKKRNKKGAGADFVDAVNEMIAELDKKDQIADGSNHGDLTEKKRLHMSSESFGTGTHCMKSPPDHEKVSDHISKESGEGHQPLKNRAEFRIPSALKQTDNEAAKDERHKPFKKRAEFRMPYALKQTDNEAAKDEGHLPFKKRAEFRMPYAAKQTDNEAAKDEGHLPFKKRAEFRMPYAAKQTDNEAAKDEGHLPFKKRAEFRMPYAAKQTDNEAAKDKEESNT